MIPDISTRRIIVSGASGQFGRKATELLRRRVAPDQLILVSRNPGALSGEAEGGADVRCGDFDDAASLDQAFAGGDAMLLISTLSVGRRAEQHRRAIEAAKRVGVRHIVYTSTGGMHPANPAIVVPDHYQTEQALRSSGLDYTLMRDSLYAESALLQILPRAIATGQMRSATGAGLVPFVAKSDCVECAVAVLTGEGHEGKTYEITGPDLLGMQDLCALASEISGRPIQFTAISDEELDADLAAAGVPKHYEEGMHTPIIGTSSRDDIISYERGIRGGYFALKSDDVRRLTGHSPMSFRDNFLRRMEEIMALAGQVQGQQREVVR